MEYLATTPFNITLDAVDNFSKKKKHKRKTQDSHRNKQVSRDENSSTPKKQKKIDADMDDAHKLSKHKMSNSTRVIEAKEHTKIKMGLAKLLENFGNSEDSSPETNIDDEIHTPVKKRKKPRNIDFSLLSGSNTSGGKVILNTYNINSGISADEDKTQTSTDESAQACTPLKKVKKKLTKFYNGDVNNFSPLAKIPKKNINPSEEPNSVNNNKELNIHNFLHRNAIDELKEGKNTSLDSNANKHRKGEKQGMRKNTNGIIQLSDSEIKSRKIEKKGVSVECELTSGDENEKKRRTTHNNLNTVKLNKHSQENENQHSVSDTIGKAVDHYNKSKATKPEENKHLKNRHCLPLSLPENGTSNKINKIMEPYKERKSKKAEKRIIELENQDLTDIQALVNGKQEQIKYNNLNERIEKDVDTPKDESNSCSREHLISKSTKNDSISSTTEESIDQDESKSTKSKKRKHLTNGMNKITDSCDNDKKSRKAEKKKISAERELESNLNSDKQHNVDIPVKLKKKKRKKKYSISDSDTSRTSENIQKHKEKAKKEITVKREADNSSIYPDYMEMMEIVDYSSRRISDEHKEMLRNLIVTNPWPIPPSHLIETRMSTHPSKSQQMKFNEQGFNMITDHYTSAEDNIITDNWNQFCKLHGIPNDPEPFLAFEASRDTKAEGSVLPKLQRINFVRFLGHNLPNRCLFSIYKRFKKLFSTRRKGRFTSQEDNAILNFVKNSTDPKKFSQLAVILHRDRHAIMLRYKVLTRTSKNNIQKSSNNDGDNTSM
ncbi:hypothetical protein FQR65_LT12454 [Abscondita terminalis]|nr:hypothetical protein FQR65_LT12454 [Abscondita terminalis]